MHFLPLLFGIVDMIPWFNKSSQAQQQAITEIVLNKSFFINNTTGIVANHINLLLRTILTTVYLLFSWRLTLRSDIVKKSIGSAQAKMWLIFLLISISIVQVVTLFPFIAKIVFGYHQFDSQIYIQYSSITSVLLLGMIIFVLYNPIILYGYVFSKSGYQINHRKIVLQNSSVSLEIEDLKELKTSFSSIKIENEAMYLLKIKDFMETEKPFLDASFTIGLLSQKTEILPHHCSYLINYILKTSFRDWINEYRVTYFITSYPDNSKLKTINSFALECGFNNKMTFYNAFKKAKGSSPKKFFKV